MHLLMHTVHQKLRKKESICRSHLTNNERVFPPFFKKDGFFTRLPINNINKKIKKKFIKLIKLTSH